MIQSEVPTVSKLHFTQKLFFPAFFERICKYLFDPEISRNMVLAHEDLSSCRLELEVVAISVVKEL